MKRLCALGAADRGFREVCKRIGFLGEKMLGISTSLMGHDTPSIHTQREDDRKSPQKICTKN